MLLITRQTHKHESGNPVWTRRCWCAS